MHSVPEAVAALGASPRRVFLAIGRQEAFHFESAPQHHYLIRSVDPVEPPLRCPMPLHPRDRPVRRKTNCDLLRQNRIDVIVAKNSGGTATYGKIAAARALGIEVIMVERQQPADVRAVETVEEALGLIDHLALPRDEARRIDEIRSCPARNDPRLRRADDDAGRHIGLLRVRIRQAA